MGLTYQLFLYVLAVFLPAAVVASSVKSPDHDNQPFRFSQLFTERVPLLIGVANVFYLLSAYTAFKILDCSYAFPLLYVYPVLYIVLAYAINKSHVFLYEIITYTLSIAGVACMCYAGYARATPSTKEKGTLRLGTALMVLAALFLALYFVFLKRGAGRAVVLCGKVHHAGGVSVVHLAAVQLLEATTVPLVVTALMAAFLGGAARWRASWLERQRLRWPLLKRTFLDDSTGSGWRTVGTLFLLYMVLSLSCNACSILANDYLDPQVFASTEYIAYVGLGTVAGVLFLKEKLPPAGTVGLCLIVAASVANIALTLKREIPVSPPHPSTTPDFQDTKTTKKDHTRTDAL